MGGRGQNGGTKTGHACETALRGYERGRRKGGCGGEMQKKQAKLRLKRQNTGAKLTLIHKRGVIEEV